MKRPEVENVLSRLKPFQRRTVDYVFERLYLAEDSTHRFLVADEVGLGKTLVARGVIAKTVDRLWEKLEDIGRIDIVYICSNTTIARQNIRRLNPFPEYEATLSSRLTLLAQQIHDLEKNPVNFIALTPGTSFDLKSSMGIREERALMYWMLPERWRGPGLGALNLLQGWAGRRSFRNIVKQVLVYRRIHKRMKEAFGEALKRRVEADREAGREDLEARFRRVAGEFRFFRETSDRAYAERSELVGELRQILAMTSVEALEPDLVILDEFQRFKDLLHGEGGTADLARELFSYSDEHTDVRLLLLSATPYKMYTLHHEEHEENHYEDFLKTVEFLDDDAGRHRAFTSRLEAFREETYRLASTGSSQLPRLKEQIEGHLRRVMSRTERTAAAREMLHEVPTPGVDLTLEDVRAFQKTQKVAALLDHPEILEFWKSAPYLFNLMDDYKVKSELSHRLQSPAFAEDIAKELEAAPGFLISSGSVEAYDVIDPGNPRLRNLVKETAEAGAWKRLWIAPALPYYRLEGAFAEEGADRFTKRLVFSSWRVVPKAVATLLTYEAERQIFTRYDRAVDRFTRYDRTGIRGLLRFARQEERLTGMPVLGILYPSIALARLGDPLAFHRERWSGDEPPSLQSVKAWVQERIEEALQPIVRGTERTSDDPFDRDERWYWAAPLLLDARSDPESSHEWLGRKDLAKRWSGSDPGEEGESEIWAEHVGLARAAAAGGLELGPPPADLARVLTQMAIAGPGVTALRAIARVCGGTEALSVIAVRDAAARVAWSLRDRFNRPEVLAVLRGEDADEPYWQRVLSYSETGCLTAVLDEYAHLLRELLGLFDASVEETASGVADAMEEAMTIRAVPLRYDDYLPDDHHGVRVDKKSFRCHFALPFGRARSEDEKTAVREEQVRNAFNSPFWPFVLVSTSIGQEGLDFHTHCHAVVHWNLPSNPVDLEQREGRVHRYKGHAVRKNVAHAFRAEALRSGAPDPWEMVFQLAEQEAAQDSDGEADGLVPFWLYSTDNGAHIERHAPMLPLSRDRLQLDALRRSLAVYRMVFGQPRQDDLLAYLMEKLDGKELEAAKELLQIDLRPPGKELAGELS